ncbi:pilus assembly protein TadG-related protein [Occultella kanbiaonis]|uniref:pilus assembly protein TadG-related protein n=1 Tax=Occultella kanbiaonis TaxID=2675754 RepID=UPI0012B722AD|nr:pilus assembly protein TadG-related protein [Occultella kanbiaonis]
MRHAAGPRVDTERGSITPAAVMFSIVLLLIIGLVVDGGRKLNAVARAGDVAAQAAHAAAQQLDAGTVLLGGGAIVDPAQAHAAGQAVLAAAGMTGEVVVDGDRVLVTATCSRPTAFLSLINITTVQGTGSAEVRLATGGP